MKMEKIDIVSKQTNKQTNRVINKETRLFRIDEKIKKINCY